MIKSINIYKGYNGVLKGDISISISDNNVDTLTVNLPSEIINSITNNCTNFINAKKLSVSEDLKANTSNVYRIVK